LDSLLGATAAQHGLTMVTRNSKDFKNLGLKVLNPWTD
jgi:predicted nucleic acid-binding protein